MSKRRKKKSAHSDFVPNPVRERTGLDAGTQNVKPQSVKGSPDRMRAVVKTELALASALVKPTPWNIAKAAKQLWNNREELNLLPSVGGDTHGET